MSLARWIERHAAFTPAKVALHFEDQALAYADLAERTRRLAAGLRRELGIRGGDRVAWLGLNHPDCLVLLFACARLGAILVPLNWRLAPAEHRAILADAEPKALFCQAALREQIEEIRSGFPQCGLIGSDFAGEGWAAAGDLLNEEASSGESEGNPEDAVLIVYTSGTTGQPKGAVLTQDALLWNAVNSAHMHDLTSADHVLTVLPLFHVGGLNIQTLPALHAGASVTLHRRFEPGSTLEAIALRRPTLTVLVPATMRALVDHPAWPQTDLTSLRLVTTGSQIVSLEHPGVSRPRRAGGPGLRHHRDRADRGLPAARGWRALAPLDRQACAALRSADHRRRGAGRAGRGARRGADPRPERHEPLLAQP
jgi:fatty-acyl-CoA synthase